MPLTKQSFRKFTLATIFVLAAGILMFWRLNTEISGQYSSLAHDEEVIFFPTSGSLNDQANNWSVPVHGWIFEREEDSVWRSALLDTLLNSMDLGKNVLQNELFHSRAGLFLVDNERGKQLAIRLAGQVFVLTPSNANGQVTASLQVAQKRGTNSQLTTWLELEAIMPAGDSRSFSGQVQLIAPEGISVISDIDDTIKKSNVLDKSELLANTLLRQFEAVPGMATVYRHWAATDAAFHYVSLSPWQIYPAMSEFIKEHDFPAGSFHMRTFQLNDRTVFQLLENPAWFKPDTIESILKRFPKRRFILVGDSGEKDPEVYGDIARKQPGQILHIAIRNVTNHSPDGERYAAAFQGLPRKSWTVFQEPKELLKIPLVDSDR